MSGRNRISFSAGIELTISTALPDDWKKFVETEETLFQEERALMLKLRDENPSLKIVEIPEVFAPSNQDSVSRLSDFARRVL